MKKERLGVLLLNATQMLFGVDKAGESSGKEFCQGLSFIWGEEFSKPTKHRLPVSQKTRARHVGFYSRGSI